MLDLPAEFLNVPYNGARYPGAEGVAGLQGGANCQLFAYELLRHFGLTPPELRSSELWEDDERTERVTAWEPLDLLLFNATRSSYGAHVAVYLGDGRAVHLARQVGIPAVWTIQQFLATPRYRCLLGAKRVRRG